jgi:hypothetical protein
MAKVLNPLNSTEARGKVGGLVYNTWRGIRTVKTHTPPSGQGVGPRAVAFDKIVQAGKRWSTLTDAQRRAWYDYAQNHVEPHWTGVDKRLPAYNWYVRIQVNRQWIGKGYEDTPPQSVVPATFPDLAATFDDIEIAITWDPHDVGGAGVVFATIFYAGPHSPGYHATLHDAKHYDCCDYFDGEYAFEPGAEGTYTIFLRPHAADGVPGTWRSIIPTAI